MSAYKLNMKRNINLNHPLIGQEYTVVDPPEEDEIVDGQSLVPVEQYEQPMGPDQVSVEHYDDPYLDDGERIPWDVDTFEEYVENGVLQI